jgi:hypothetical protein
VIFRKARWLGRKSVLCASAGAVLALLAGAALPGAAGGATSAATVKAANGTAAVTLGATPLGMDVGPWDTLYSTTSPAKLSVIQSYLKAAGIDQLHYGGGGTADQYDWQNNTEINNNSPVSKGGCGPAPTIEAFGSPCATPQPLDFKHFSANARALGAQSFVTVNYGTGSPAMAAAWVTQADATPGQSVAQWSIGNEDYGCWEYDDWLTGDPADDPDYQANDSPTCPADIAGDGIPMMAQSYADNALPYMEEMTAAATAAGDSIKIGVPWAFDYHVGGAAVTDNTSWNDTILQQDGQYIGFVEAHWYPFGFSGDVGEDGNPTAQSVIQSVEQIPADYASMAAELSQDGSNATVTVGETGVSFAPTNMPCLPAGALFSAGDALEWLAAGAQNVDWFPLETGTNTGSVCNQPDEAMFTGNGTPDTMYTGYLLASQLAQPNAQLSSLTTSNPGVLAFQSVLPAGQVAVALINTVTSTSERVTVNTSLTGNLSTESYSAGDQNAVTATSPPPAKIVDGTATAGAIAGGITLPPESILVLKTQEPSKVTLGAAATVKAGTNVTLRGTLTVNGAAAPAGTPVKIYRRVSGSSVNSATLSAKTTAGGAFTATDLPPGYGSYDYVASYAGSGVYAAASATFPVRVTAVKPALRLAFSAGSARPGRKVTVTAALGAWHTNRTLVIYAQPKGSAKKVIERGTINSKGQLAVAFTMKTNTTFTVTFSGDSWYGSASATGTVKA